MAASLFRRRIMVVEDDYLVLEMLNLDLIEAGATVVGLATSVAAALGVLDEEADIDAAILDVNLGPELVFPVADALTLRKIPFLFATGCEKALIRRRYPIAPICLKPCEFKCLNGILVALIC
jgi:DNA-binding response OmpR family regulator